MHSKIIKNPKIWVATCNNKQGAEIDKPFPEKMLKSSLFSESVLIKIIKKIRLNDDTKEYIFTITNPVSYLYSGIPGCRNLLQ